MGVLLFVKYPKAEKEAKSERKESEISETRPLSKHRPVPHFPFYQTIGLLYTKYGFGFSLKTNIAQRYF